MCVCVCVCVGWGDRCGKGCQAPHQRNWHLSIFRAYWVSRLALSELISKKKKTRVRERMLNGRKLDCLESKWFSSLARE